MRVLLYANVDAAEAGGVQGVVRALRGHLRQQGHRVTIGWAARSRGAVSCGEDGWAEAFHLRGGNGSRQLHRRTLARCALRLLRERPDVVHIHYAAPGARYFQALAPWLGFGVVVTCHGSDILRPLAHDAPHLAQVIGGADAVTVVSQDLAAGLAALGLAPRRGPEVIANGVDTGFWKPPESRAPPCTPPRIVAIGRLEQVKGLDILIEACAMLAARGQATRLTIIGEGSQGEALAALATRLGIGAQVTLAGRLPPPAIRDALHAATAFVLPSRSEGMPLALMEALASGTPTIATDVGGIAPTAGGAALLVEAENPAGLAEAIARLVGDDGLRADLRQKAQERARAFSVEAGHAAYEALLSDIARTRRS